MDGWIDELAAELGEDPLTREEVTDLLSVSRDVAHRVERKTTPLAAFVLGSAVGRAEASGMDRASAMQGVFETLARVLPDAPADAERPGPATPEELDEARGDAPMGLADGGGTLGG